ncbi:hypothetical protein A5658_03375 [Mycobacterium sp. 1245111.1]|uniref:hypothetical protein n=1 Tax=Mycobacterium sp. 1245111.1 TaxID=1834073 RepID=UPI000800A42C|nr:hypothetical protein [Mycobacterium sp. 1245111.1]OBK38574.1 hypothetical protein A5658_03375 [Mycobacterium sp. 1245111.1]
MKVTVIPTMYRDAPTYKTDGEIHLRGEISARQIEQLRGALSDGKRYVPAQLGLDHYGSWASSNFPSDDDVGWQELLLDELSVEDRDPDFRPLFSSPTTEIAGSAEEFVAKVLAAAEAGWDPSLHVD